MHTSVLPILVVNTLGQTIELDKNQSHGQSTILLCKIWSMPLITSDAHFQVNLDCWMSNVSKSTLAQLLLESAVHIEIWGRLMNLRPFPHFLRPK